MKQILIKQDNEDEEIYLNENFILQRETGKTPNGNQLGGRWVLRNRKNNDFIDFDQFRHDLAERYELTLMDYSLDRSYNFDRFVMGIF